MGLQRTVRNAVCWLLAIALIRLGYTKRAKRESFQEGTITSIYSHNPNRKLFRRIVTWLKDNRYTFISCDQLIDIINKRIACPRGAVWISMDDGWKWNIDNVIPTVVKYNIPITLFINTNAVEGGTFWWTDVMRYANHLPVEFSDSETIRKLPEDARKQITRLIEQIGSNIPSRREAMTVEDVRRISEIPQIAIGSHTVTHPTLPNCDESQIDYELGESKRKLEGWIGKPIRAFSYPFGRFDGRERRFLKKYGYELAATSEDKFVRLNGDSYLLPRTDVMDDGSFAENLCHALGVWQPIVSKIKHIIKLRGRPQC